jgi:pyruvate dehydrogenase E1 component alpha subunit
MTPSSPPTASTGTRWCKGVSANESIMAEMYGKVDRVLGGRGGSMHLFDKDDALLRRQRHRRRGAPARRRLALADQMRKRSRVTACFFGEGAMAEGEFHESDEPRGAVEPAGAVLLREQPLRDGHRALAFRVAGRPRRRETYAIRGRSVDGMDVVAVEAAARDAVAHVRSGEGPILSSRRGPIASARTRCSTRSSIARRKRSRAGRSATRSPNFDSARLREAGVLDDSTV